jgi:cyclophilin family peptidyl-prolyl cis-trans isomerase
MTLPSRNTARLFFSTLFTSVVLLTADAMAVAPAAPSNGSLQFTRIGYPDNNQANTPLVDSWFSWLLRWNDNAVDEEGYEIRARFGTGGPFYTMARLGPGTTAALISTGVPQDQYGHRVEADIQFQVIAWKFTGSTTESSTLAINGKVPNTSAAVTWAPPATATAQMTVLEPGATPVINDGQVQISWADTNNSELYHMLFIGEVIGGTTPPPVVYNAITYVPFNITSATVSNQTSLIGTDPVKQLQLVPGKTYRFGVRATRTNKLSETDSTKATNMTVSGDLTIPALLKPANLSASLAGENSVKLRWTDRSQNETGYEIQSRQITADAPPPFEVIGTVGAGISEVTAPMNQTNTVEFRVRALYSYLPAGSPAGTANTVVYSDFADNTIQVSTTTFSPPSELTATTSGIANTIDLTWKDNTSSELGFNVYCRPVGNIGSYHFCRAVRDNVKKISVNSFTTGNELTGSPTFTPLVVGTAYEFVVRAVGNLENSFSADSNVVFATPREGFTSRLYQPVSQGASFSFSITTSSTPAAPTSVGVTGLPAGLSFNGSNGQITGTPTVSGLFTCPMTAVYASGTTATANLILRVVPATALPVVAGAIPNLLVGLNQPTRIPLTGYFADADTEAAVRLVTSKGNIDLVLFATLAPKAVANFMAYINGGDYRNVLFHRNIPGFVLQAGSTRINSAGTGFESVPGRPPALNEPGITNVQWTIAAAKLGQRNSMLRNNDGTLVRDSNGNTQARSVTDAQGYYGDPDSATTDFYISLGNNVANLDNQNGGFTAFGRVSSATGGSRNVVNTITALPIGNYGGGLTDLPVDAASVPSSLAFNQTVRITDAFAIPTFSYTVDDTSATIASVVVEGSDLVVKGLAAGTRTVNVTARDLDGNNVSQSFTITVDPTLITPAITKQPTSLDLAVGAKATFSVTATGSNLVYQWRRNSAPISGKNQPTLVIERAAAGDSGLYDVTVTNAVTTITSVPARLSLRTAPVIVSSPPSRFVDAGSALILEATATGSPQPAFTWKRGTTTVTGQTSSFDVATGRIKSTLTIPSAALTHAGIYKATARNTAGSADTTEAQVFVIERRTRLQVEKPGATVKLTAPAAGPLLTYQWSINDRAIAPGTARYSGDQDATLVITNANVLADSGAYTCAITTPGPSGLGTTVSGVIQLAIANRPALTAMTGDNAPPAGFVSRNYLYDIPYSTAPSNQPSSFTITGLPPGLTYDKATGRITGRPTKAGTFTLRATATNPMGTSDAVTGTITIGPMLGYGTGAFVGSVAPSPTLNKDKGGRLDLLVTDDSAYSAVLQMGAETLRAAGSVVFAVGSNGGITYNSVVSFPRTGGRPPLLLGFTVDPSNGNFAGIITDGTAGINVSGYRLFWDATRRPGPSGQGIIYNSGPITFSYSCNVALDLDTPHVGQASIPQGTGYMALTVSSAGRATITGRLADNTLLTASTLISSERQMLFFQMLNSNTASFSGILGMDVISGLGQPVRVQGNIRWIKDAQTSTAERNYKAGFPAVTLKALGTSYFAPGTNKIVLGIPDLANNLTIDFSEGGLGTANPDITVTLPGTNKAVFPPTNSSKVSLTIFPATGSFNGTFDLTDGAITRRAAFQGLLIPALTPYAPPRGAGFFLLPELLPSITKSPVRSGKVALVPPAVIFTTHPTGLELDVSASTTLTAAASGPGTLIYQWQLNGATIPTTGDARFSGANTQSLTITSMSAAIAGDYVCVASNGSLAAFSNAANVILRVPVTAVTAARLPADAAVAVGTSVTFTATVTAGSAPLTYQWKKDNVAIGGATSQTYTIPSTIGSDSGSYKVAVSNSLTTTPLESAAVPLAVGNPVTNVQISRNPNTTAVALSSTVTFTVTAEGTAPFTYQWFKGTTDIIGANSATYVINSVSSLDTGSYNCRVFNSATPAGATLASNVPLTVMDGVSDINVTKSYSTEGVATNTDITFNVTANGENLSYQWRKNSVPVFGATSSSYIVNSGSTPTTDTYDVLVSNPTGPDGIASSAITVIVVQPITMVAANRTPMTATVTALTDPVVFSAAPDGTGPYTYVWRKDGTPISGATGSTYTLSLPVETDDGNYDCIVTNLLGVGITSNSVALDITSPP